VELFIGTIHEVPFHRQAADRAAAIRAQLEQRGAMIGPYDVLLAGQAMADGLTLVSSNTGEFARIEGLRIVDWRAGKPSP
jgi:tRNA(fMet)-specific endonuclease VapC